MKTIALKEQTFQILIDLKRKEKSSTFDELIAGLVLKKEKIPDSMKGSLKGKTKSFTNKEREEMWKDKIF